MEPLPSQGRTFTARRRVRLTDMDARGRLRLDAVARFLQDVAIDDVDETGWGAPDHLWFVRRMRVDVLEPFLADREVELVTWSSGRATSRTGECWIAHSRPPRPARSGSWRTRTRRSAFRRWPPSGSYTPRTRRPASK